MDYISFKAEDLFLNPERQAELANFFERLPVEDTFISSAELNGATFLDENKSPLIYEDYGSLIVKLLIIESQSKINGAEIVMRGVTECSLSIEHDLELSFDFTSDHIIVYLCKDMPGIKTKRMFCRYAYEEAIITSREDQD